MAHLENIYYTLKLMQNVSPFTNLFNFNEISCCVIFFALPQMVFMLYQNILEIFNILYTI